MKSKLVLLLMVAALLLSACGTAATPTSGGGEVTPKPGGGGAQTVVRMWAHTNNAFIAGYETLIAAYEAEHPDVDIQLEHFDYELYLQTLQTAMPAGEEADIIQLFGTWTSQYYERLAPVPAGGDDARAGPADILCSSDRRLCRRWRAVWLPAGVQLRVRRRAGQQDPVRGGRI